MSADGVDWVRLCDPRKSIDDNLKRKFSLNMAIIAHLHNRMQTPEGAAKEYAQNYTHRHTLYYEAIGGYDFTWQSTDGSIVQAPARAKMNATEGFGANPTDRHRKGTKFHVRCDANGVPIAIEITNVHETENHSVYEYITMG